MLSCEIWEIFKNNFFHRTPPVAASKQTQDISGFIVWQNDTLVI